MASQAAPGRPLRLARIKFDIPGSQGIRMEKIGNETEHRNECFTEKKTKNNCCNKVQALFLFQSR